MGPSRWWFAVAGLVGVAGIVVALVLIVNAAIDYDERIDDFQRAQVPGAFQFQFDEPGGYSLYYEAPGASSLDRAPQLDVTMTPLRGGEPVAFDDYGSTVTYSTGHEGIAAATFRIDEPGPYRIVTDGPFGVVAVGPSIARGIVRSVLVGIAIGLTAVLAAAGIALATGLGRIRARRSAFPPAHRGP